MCCRHAASACGQHGPESWTEARIRPVTEPTPTLAGGQLLVALSDGMVRLFRDFLGKGPDRCKAHWAGDDMLVVLLGGGYTVAEQTLYDAGRGDAVQDSRYALQMALEAQSTAMVERLTGRRVVAFMSASHQGPDLSAEIFVFAPAEPDSAGRSD